jgi:hypothetical protein
MDKHYVISRTFADDSCCGVQHRLRLVKTRIAIIAGKVGNLAVLPPARGAILADLTGGERTAEEHVRPPLPRLLVPQAPEAHHRHQQQEQDRKGDRRPTTPARTCARAPCVV